MGRREILLFIGCRNGAYGNEIPDDADTLACLSRLVEDGLVRSETCRLDDYFYLTKAGKRASRS